jgi:hypothetical protein
VVCAVVKWLSYWSIVWIEYELFLEFQIAWGYLELVSGPIGENQKKKIKIDYD